MTVFHGPARLAAVLTLVSTAVLAGSGAPADATTRHPNPLGIPGNWRSVFSEDFDGSRLNTARWEAASHAPGDGLNCYSPGQVSVHGGQLHLRLERRTTTCAAGTVTRPYVSGAVSTSGRFTLTPGMAFQARIHLPPTNRGAVANWPAFWATAWPATGEIDVVEGLGRGAHNTCWSVHPEPTDPGGCTTPMVGWHTFGALWHDDGTVTVYYDGRKAGTSVRLAGNPEFLVLDNALAEWNTHDGTALVPATVRVDYIRAWTPQPPGHPSG